MSSGTLTTGCGSLRQPLKGSDTLKLGGCTLKSGSITLEQVMALSDKAAALYYKLILVSDTLKHAAADPIRSWPSQEDQYCGWQPLK